MQFSVPTGQAQLLLAATVTSNIHACQLSNDLHICKECVWVEISALDGHDLTAGNYYFSPNTKHETISHFICRRWTE